MQKGDKISLNFVVNEKVYNSFLETYNDKNPLHTNTDFAISKGFQDKVMHGNILNGFLSYFIGECLPTKSVIIHSQKIEYKLPVYLNDNLSFEAELSDIHDSVKVYEYKFNFTNAHKNKVAQGKIQIGLI